VKSISTDKARPRRAVAAALAIALSAPSIAAIAAVSEADADAAKKLWADGVRLEPTDLATARDRFKGAFKLRPSPIIGLKLGDVHERLGELVEARQVFQRAATVSPDEFLDVGVKQESLNAQDARKQARARAQALEDRIPTIDVHLSNVPADAKPKVTIDGVEIPIEALAVPRSANPGKHLIVVTIRDRAPKTAEIELVEKDRRVVEIDLRPDPAATTTPPDSKPATPPGATTAPALTPTPERRASGSATRTVGWIGFGVGGAGLIVGGVAGVLALGKASTVKDGCPNQICPPSHHDDLDAAKRWSTISNVGFGVAVLGLGVGLWGVLSSRSRETATTPASTTTATPPPRAQVQPWIGVGSVGVVGTF
jgi:hypothetical protein